MNIKIIKEKKDQYLVTMVNDLGIHAIGKTPALALEYFIDVYEQTTQLRKDILIQKSKLLELKHSPLLQSSFKSLQLSF